MKQKNMNIMMIPFSSFHETNCHSGIRFFFHLTSAKAHILETLILLNAIWWGSPEQLEEQSRGILPVQNSSFRAVLDAKNEAKVVYLLKLGWKWRYASRLLWDLAKYENAKKKIKETRTNALCKEISQTYCVYHIS